MTTTTETVLSQIKTHAERFNNRDLLMLWVDATASYAPVRIRALHTLRLQGWKV